jgi:repressor LexA
MPLFAEENIEGYEFADVPEGEGYYYLRVKGDSMINSRICDGDLVLIKQQACANDGQIVACLVNGDEATLKRFYRQKDMIILKPENPAYSPIIVPCKDFDNNFARILGVVVKVEFRP